MGQSSNNHHLTHLKPLKKVKNRKKQTDLKQKNPARAYLSYAETSTLKKTNFGFYLPLLPSLLGEGLGVGSLESRRTIKNNAALNNIPRPITNTYNHFTPLVINILQCRNIIPLLVS